MICHNLIGQDYILWWGCIHLINQIININYSMSNLFNYLLIRVNLEPIKSEMGVIEAI